MTVTFKHLVLKPSRPSTILFIHGAFSSPKEWSSVARLIANLIRAEAKDGKAHIVGLSLGAHVALYLAAHYPDLIHTVFATGYNRFAPSIWKPMFPYLTYGVQNVKRMLPRFILKYLSDEAESSGEGSTPCTLSLCREVIETVISDREISAVSARTLVIAATNGGLLPSDSVKTARLVGKRMKTGNAESKIVEVRGMRHAWNTQDPQLFATSVEAWIDETPLSKKFTEL